MTVKQFDLSVKKLFKDSLLIFDMIILKIQRSAQQPQNIFGEDFMTLEHN